MEDLVILVDQDDNETGVMEKMQAHKEAVLHRAFSIFIFNSKGELMLQQRALNKYHSPGLWTNTCCSHPRPGEKTIDAAHRRLVEEMGFDCTFNEAFSFVYKAPFENKLTEHEYDHVFIGICDTIPSLNKDEVNSYRMATLNQVSAEMDNNPELFTVWFRIAFDRVKKYFKDIKK
ncbi:MAG TPA: isopentenyl-diphosphate Delta-isomerase [Lentimicrobium sp.]|nr:isopentenyl-diphosphate Delta-isomerase [Lentimicrobium sp.]